MFALVCTIVQAQTAISGYVNINEQDTWEQQVYLMEVAVKEDLKLDQGKIIAKTPIQQDGTFAFQRKLLADHNTIYRVYVNRIKKLKNKRNHTDKVFILSNTDSLHFRKGSAIFGEYYSTNAADKDWQRLRRFEADFFKRNVGESEAITENYVSEVKQYTKDSLQILWVKLLGIKQLEDKKLLDKDILVNPEYYMALLSELKASELGPSEYLFLENKLAFLKHQAVAKKYTYSRWINIVLGGLLVLALLGLLQFRKRKNTAVLSDLSQREQNIQQLILAGKSNKEIANELFISVSTVKTHVTHIYHKLKVANRKELLQKWGNYTSTST